MIRIPELKIIEKSEQEFFDLDIGTTYGFDYYEPLLAYAEVIADKYMPMNEHNFRGTYISGAIVDFIGRYYDDIVDKAGLNRFQRDNELQEAIASWGYDLEQFWYLTLFILDFSTGACQKRFKQEASVKDHLKAFTAFVADNTGELKSEESSELIFIEPMSISIEIGEKRKKKHTIVDNDALFIINQAVLQMIDSIEDESGKLHFFKYDPTTEKQHIAYFAKMFFDFFELRPTEQKKRAPNNSAKDYSKMFIVSKLIYIVGLSNQEGYYSSPDLLKKTIRRNRGLDIDSQNGFYI